MRRGRRVAVLVALLMASAGARAADAADAAIPTDDAAIVHALGRLGFGARPGDVERVRAIGLPSWIERQLDPGQLDDRAVEQKLAGLPTLTMSIADLHADYPRPQARALSADAQMRPSGLYERPPLPKRPIRIVAELSTARLLRAIDSERQLEEVMVDFWLNHFNVYAAKGEVKWYLTSYERDVIRPNALGRFAELLRGTARHPAMLFYLDDWLSTRPDFTVRFGPNRGKRAGLNENYARELMELHTLGVDGGYTQNDVIEVARAFTGWTIERPRDAARFVFRPQMHDRGEKIVLGARFPAGGGQDDGERVLSLLAHHPATATFVASKLVRRFVADEPPPALVARVAATFRASDGDVKAMLRTIVTSPEFWAPAARGAKVKKPFEYIASAVRAVGGHADARAGFVLARSVAEMGEGLYASQAPTGYPDRAETWVNAGALLARMNFALALTQNRLRGVTVDFSALALDRAAPDAALERLLTSLLHGEATAQTRGVLTAQLANPEIRRQTPDDRGPADTDVEKLAALVLGSPEFQRR